ncbi:probable 3',5'-cyclic phosphodiesterase pde-5 isoform X3 [Haliotis rufescens]|uniref:probable 3',5'-cyclic phosphodiesterase pde-5 isoform X3 n=1 Tax=Haliotis rufescens TaxID=6454 RepID=UPI00201EC06D|nr:probable 3',5'-cyclic phosphodiesterase pde-5 isoform X3 [Haliotis rufescens]
MNNRRLPPLPFKGKRALTPRASQRSPSSPQPLPVPEMVITGYSTIQGSGNHGGNLGGINNGRINLHDLNQDLVSEYLDHNPEFLDHYVHARVSLDQIDRWQLRKLRPPSRYNNRPQSMEHLSVNGENHGDNKSSLSKWKSRIQSSRGRVLQELAREVYQPNGKAIILHELAGCVCSAINADGYNLYIVDENKREVMYVPNVNSSKPMSSSGPSNGDRICLGTTVAAHVAHTQETVRLKDPHGDGRFPEGLGHGNIKVHSVLALPLQDGRGSLLGVVEFYRNFKYTSFTEEEEEVSILLLMWADMLVDYVEVHSSMLKQRKLNEFLLTVTKSVFQDIISMDTVIMKIMNFAQKLVNADRASLFLLDHHRQELFARIFDVGSTMGVPSPESSQQKEIRFPMGKGVAGHVATTGEVLNIQDAYGDIRFNRDVDLQTGYRTKSILCMPIYIRGNIIGVVQMVNKMSGPFTRADEEAFETFAIYCGLALHHAKLYEKIRRSEQKYKVALEVLSYHSQCSEEEMMSLRSSPVPHDMHAITSYAYSPWGIDNDEKPLYVLYMFKDLFGTMSSVSDPRFDTDALIRFTLTVRKNYRNVPYHNWVHAFSVAHSMYTVIKRAAHQFTPLESLALFVACLCHDLDHRGKTNAFMVKSASPLAAIYSTSTMEHHHFNQTVAILQHEGHNIFKHLCSEEYKKVLGDIRHCILATDLALFFGNRAKLKDIADRNDFSWDIQEHRRVLRDIAMTSCDLCAMTKPWDVQAETVKVIYEEFYAQGDEEKEQGMTPMAMMDRDKKHELPQLEVGFIVGICLPCYELLAQILPATTPMVEGIRANLSKWQEMAEEAKEESK